MSPSAEDRNSLKDTEKYFTSLVREFHYLFGHLPLKDNKREIPTPVAFEFQHSLVHLALSTHGKYDIKDKIGQYIKAAEHLKRGVIDGWKVLIYGAEVRATILNSKVLFGRLLTCRLSEYKGNADLSVSSIERYSTFYRAVKSFDTNRKLTASCPELLKTVDSNMAKGIHRWAQYELILCSITGEKDIVALNELIQLFIGGEPSTQSINELISRVILKAIKHLDEQDCLKRLLSGKEFLFLQKELQVLKNLEQTERGPKLEAVFVSCILKPLNIEFMAC